MKLGEEMAFGTHFVDSKHGQNVDVSMDIYGYHLERQASTFPNFLRMDQ